MRNAAPFLQQLADAKPLDDIAAITGTLMPLPRKMSEAAEGAGPMEVTQNFRIVTRGENGTVPRYLIPTLQTAPRKSAVPGILDASRMTRLNESSQCSKERVSPWSNAQPSARPDMESW